MQKSKHISAIIMQNYKRKLKDRFLNFKMKISRYKISEDKKLTNLNLMILPLLNVTQKFSGLELKFKYLGYYRKLIKLKYMILMMYKN